MDSLGTKYQMEIINDIEVSQTWSLPSRVLPQSIEGRQKCEHLECKMANTEIKVKETRPGSGYFISQRKPGLLKGVIVALSPKE